MAIFHCYVSSPEGTLRFWGSKHYQTARTQRWRHEGTTLHCPSCPACHTFRPCRAHRDHALAHIQTLSSRCTSNPSWISCNEDHNRWYSLIYIYTHIYYILYILYYIILYYIILYYIILYYIILYYIILYYIYYIILYYIILYYII